MTRERSKTHPAASQPRLDRILPDSHRDAYGLRGKLPDPTACPSCGAMYRDGRWTWGAAPVDAARTECPACRRSADGYPAGLVTLSGAFAREHTDEIRGLIENLEAREKAEHPLKRVMSVREEDDGLVVSTTDAHLARAIGTALHDAYRGDLDYQFAESDGLLRVRWTR